MGSKFNHKMGRYKLAYADFRPYVVSTLGHPCSRSRKRLTRLCHQACAISVAGPWAMGPEDANHKASLIINKVAFATDKVDPYWAFRGPKEGIRVLASAAPPAPP